VKKSDVKLSASGLHLGLLVEAEHDRLLWRICIEPDHVDELLLEM